MAQRLSVLNFVTRDNNGHCTFHAGGQTVQAGAGSFVSVPRWTQHAFTVDAPDTQLLNFYLPAGFELILIGIAHPAERNESPPPGMPLPPRRLVEQLSRDYGQIAVHGLPFADPQNDSNMGTEPTPGAAAQPFRNHSDEAPAYWHAGGLWTVLADGASTNGSFCLFEQLMPSGPAAPPHLHEGMDEVFYVLEGETVFLLGDRIEVAGKGALVFIPRGTVHGFRVNGASARLLNLYTPADFERSVMLLGQPTDRRTLPPPGWTPPEVPQERRAALFADLGMQALAVADPFASTGPNP